MILRKTTWLSDGASEFQGFVTSEWFPPEDRSMWIVTGYSTTVRGRSDSSSFTLDFIESKCHSCKQN